MADQKPPSKPPLRIDPPKKGLDKTKEKVGVHKLAYDERKDMFNKFVKGGGKVVEDTSGKGGKGVSFNRDKQKEYIKKVEVGKDKRRKSEGSFDESESKKSSSEKDEGRSSASFMDRLKIHINAFMSGVSNFSGSYIPPKFFRFVGLDVKSALMGVQLVHLELFKQDPTLKHTIETDLDLKNPIYVELLQKLEHLYEKTEMDQLLYDYAKYPELGVSFKNVQGPVKSLLKKLYIIKPYHETLKKACELGVQVAQTVEGKPGSLYARKVKKAKSELDLLLVRFYPRLYWLFLKMEGKYLTEKSQALEDALSLIVEEKIGQRQLGKSKEEIEFTVKKSDEEENAPTEEGNNPQEEGQEEKSKKDEGKDAPKGVRVGLDIMKKLDVGQLKDKYDKDKRFPLVKINDKVLVTYLLFKEFDNEYSFVLTTNKIEMNPDYSSGTKVDYKVMLNDLYVDSRKCIDSLEEYGEIMKEREDVKDHPSVNYVAQSKRINALETKRNQIARNARVLVKELMEKISENLFELLKDYAGQKKLITNPEQVIYFDATVEGTKKYSGLKVVDIVKYAYCFTAAFAYRLSESGDLFGGVIELDEDRNVSVQKEKTDSLSPSQEKNADDIIDLAESGGSPKDSSLKTPLK